MRAAPRNWSTPWTFAWLLAVSPVLGMGATASGGFDDLRAGDAGAVEGWGHNAEGQLGNGTTTNSSTPVAVTVTW